mmetsp:Transcript_68853/g.224318  ORF Transcript_68853/g.224318 Transcript_68853/m.224318 type:complete len:202 (+) Transcript_68853:263-868(+)
MWLQFGSGSRDKRRKTSSAICWSPCGMLCRLHAAADVQMCQSHPTHCQDWMLACRVCRLRRRCTGPMSRAAKATSCHRQRWPKPSNHHRRGRRRSRPGRRPRRRRRSGCLLPAEAHAVCKPVRGPSSTCGRSAWPQVRPAGRPKKTAGCPRVAPPLRSASAPSPSSARHTAAAVELVAVARSAVAAHAAAVARRSRRSAAA